CQQYNSLPCTF
nr:immunoglobulin light chain junction region [Macaca mulatta]MPN93733.1 immunoglobulin light chain junction region [Macaca mulatta]MPN98462.1 immunoglobulin light chain junction region [Macaca mulatta]MPN98762.1 immunoglobulin light chain junction region [Macaca mulatta]MPO00331.1 immunoglobulin light chain junction region [Macaca mulatta]